MQGVVQNQDRTGHAAGRHSIRPAPAGVAYAGAGARKATATRARRLRSEEAQRILDTALVVERLATVFYYTGLTSPAVLLNSQLGGHSANPNNPGLPPGGNPQQVRYLQAALDAESQHAKILEDEGASSRVTRFHFPVTAFTRLGSAPYRDTFLGVMDTLETTSVGMYTAAVRELVELRELDLAQLAAEISGVESEHRMLGRAIANIRPANNLTLGVEPFAMASQAEAAIRPFLTGYGFPDGATRAFGLPSAHQIARVVGHFGTHRVQRFL